MAKGRSTALRIVVATALIVAIAGAWLSLGRLAEAGALPWAGGWLLPLLSIAVVVLVLALAGIIIRNLVRLIMDRKRGVLGSRLRTKLVFFFLALVLPPAIVLFYGSAAVIRMTVEAMLRTPVEDVTEQSRGLVDDWTDFLLAQCTRQVSVLAEEIEQGNYLDPGRRADLERLLTRWGEREALQVAVVRAGGDPIAWSVGRGVTTGDVDPAELVDYSLRLLNRGVDAKPVQGRIDYLRNGLLAHAVAPIGPRNEGAFGGDFVGVGIYLPSDLAARTKRIASVIDAYQQMRAQRRDLIRLYLALMALIFLVTVFVATWMGFYLSRRITEPIEELARASREISAGNLDVRVSADVGDEVGRLVEAFNEMAAQLQESREVISRSTADLRRSNRALDERRRYIETLVENLSTAVMSLGPDGRVTTANPATERILGVRPAEGDDPRVIFAHPGLEPLLDVVDYGALRSGKPLRSDLTLARAGERISVSVHATPLRGPLAEPMGTLIMVEDLTDLIRAQRATAWREVARRIAHEIKNPLTPIQLSAQRIRKKFEEGAPDLADILPEATASIEREVGALKRMVDEFSRFARMPEMSPETVRIEDLVGSVLALYQGLPEIRWEVAVDPAVGAVQVDAEQIRRVLINLIDNAVSAMGGKGLVRVKARAHAGPGSLRIEVADTGPGIPPADRDKMFAPYFSTKKRGTGLGLAIVHRVVTDHRGSIRVEDNEPQGARFVIEIPA